MIELRKNTDLLIVSVPFIFPICPPVGPAILKSLLQKNGWSCEVLDMNVELFRNDKMHEIFETSNEVFSFYPPVVDNRKEFLKLYEVHFQEFVKDWAAKIVESGPKIVGLSMKSNHSAYFGERLIFEIRQLNKNIPIVLGGPYALSLITYPDDRALFPLDIDIIAGDGERSVLKYMEGDRSYPGINSMPVQLDDMSLIPFPEYEEGQFDLYDKIDGVKRVYITASRGCVRRCTFCDIKMHWPKYRYREATHIYEEMVYLHEKYGRQNFKFTDSLINGNIKVLSELCQLLIDNKKRFTWGGQFICRNERSMPPEVYRLMAEAGCTYVSIGIESGSEKVRQDMKKIFSNEDIYFTLEQLNATGIKATLLMITGYITEGEKEFQETLDFFSECKKRGFFKSESNPRGGVERISFGVPFTVSPDTDDYHLLKKLNPESPFGRNWVCNGSDRRLRLERFFLGMIHLHNLGYSHLNQSQTGAGFLAMWEEFLSYKQNGEVNPALVDGFRNEFVNR